MENVEAFLQTINLIIYPKFLKSDTAYVAYCKKLVYITSHMIILCRENPTEYCKYRQNAASFCHRAR